MGRGGVVDPSGPYRNILKPEDRPVLAIRTPSWTSYSRRSGKRSTPAKRKKVLAEVMSLITEEAPAHFLWRHLLLFGMAKNVDYRPLPSERIYGWNMRVK